MFGQMSEGDMARVMAALDEVLAKSLLILEERSTESQPDMCFGQDNERQPEAARSFGRENS